MGTVENLSLAFAARRISPLAKLVLICAAAKADMDGRLFGPFESLLDECSMTDVEFRSHVHELAMADLMSFSTAIDGRDGRMRQCLQMSGIENGG